VKSHTGGVCPAGTQNYLFGGKNMVTKEQVARGLARFADVEILSKMSGNTFKRVAAGTVISLYIKNMENIISKLVKNPFVSALGIIDENENINIDYLSDELKRNMPQEGIRVDIDVLGMHIADMTLNSYDIDTLKQYIMTA
jgi:hypothetical protein